MDSLFSGAYQILMESSPELKCQYGLKLSERWKAGQLNMQGRHDVLSIPNVGRPEKPELISPRLLKRRTVHTVQGRIALMHALAHIEFNAINLAWDAVYRFQEMPEQYYSDWITVACEEARHYLSICRYLNQHGAEYGLLPAHNGLWDMALRTEHDVVARMALVPRVMEARGLDVTPKMIESFKSVDDVDAVSVLEVIYQEEIKHVEIGNHWFLYACAKQNLNPRETFKALVSEHFHGKLRGPYNLQARLQAGFDKEELEELFDVGY